MSRALSSPLAVLSRSDVRERINVEFYTVDTLAALKTLTTSEVSAGDTVFMRNRAQVRDGGHGVFDVLSGSASSNGLTADDGFVVENNAGDLTFARKSVSFANAREWGAAGNGTANDRPACQAAVDYLKAAGGGVLFMPAGSYRLDTQLSVSGSNIVILGAGWNGFHDVGSSTYSARFIWYGATNGTMLSFAPTEGASAQGLVGCGLVGVTLEGRDAAGTNILVKSVRNGQWYFHTQATTQTNVLFDVAATLGEVRDNQRNTGFITVRQIGSTGDAVELRGDAGANTSLNELSFDIQHQNGDGLILSNTDNNVYPFVRANRAAGGTGRGIVCEGGATSDEACRDELFLYMHPGAGGVELEGTGTWTVAPTGIYAAQYDDQAGGSLAIGAGARFAYRTKKNVNVGALFNGAVLADSVAQAEANRDELGSGTVVIYNGSNNHARLINGTDDWSVSIDAATGNLRVLRLAGAGKILLGQDVDATGFQVSGNGVVGERVVNADLTAVTLNNVNNAIGGLGISATYDQVEIQALRDKCEELADDVRALAALVEAQRAVIDAHGLGKPT